MLALAVGCSTGSGLRTSGFFPASNEVPGWSNSGQVRTFDAANLWQYIDGGAEKYLQAGVEKTLTADYRYRDGLEAVADVYVMKTGDAALKVLESEPASGSRRCELGNECRQFPNSVVFRQGRYIVRLTAYSDAPDAGTDLVLLGRGIEQRIGPHD